MRLAYLISAYKQPSLFKRMFRAIHDPRNHYLVHVDKKSPAEVHQELRSFLADFPNAKVMESRNWVYGGYTAVDIQMQGMKELLKEEWDFFLNVTGQDFPLKTQEEMKAVLEGQRGRNFVQMVELHKEWPESLFRIRWYFVELRGRVPLPARKRLIPLPIRTKFIKGVVPHGGSSWFILGREFCRYFTEHPSVDVYKRFYRHTYIPEEGIFHTVLAHSPFKETWVNDNKRLIMWPGGRIHTFGIEDLKKLEESDAFFARKFNESVDSLVIGRLEARLGDRVAGAVG